MDFLMVKWDKVFKNGPSKIFQLLSSANFTWSILEYLGPNEFTLNACLRLKFCRYGIDVPSDSDYLLCICETDQIPGCIHFV